MRYDGLVCWMFSVGVVLVEPELANMGDHGKVHTVSSAFVAFYVSIR